jgi:hypothetical protein
MSFEGFTFNAKTATASGIKNARAGLDRDLDDLVQERKREKRAEREARGLGRKRDGGNQNRKDSGKRDDSGKKDNNGKDVKKTQNQQGKRTWDINVPEAALRQILDAAGVSAPGDRYELKLVAFRKDQ